MNPTSQPPILRSEAHVSTSRSERYAKQLCNHAAHMASRAQWRPPQGIIEFPANLGTCRITSEPGRLVLALQSADPGQPQQDAADHRQRHRAVRRPGRPDGAVGDALKPMRLLLTCGPQWPGGWAEAVASLLRSWPAVGMLWSRERGE
jgi:hypothetical protein